MGLMRIEAVSAGDDFSLALNDKGEVFGWGNNMYANLGLGDYNYGTRDTPTIIQGDLKGKRIVSIAACKYHSLAVDIDGNVYSWGTNSIMVGGVTYGGFLGIPMGKNHYTPKQISISLDEELEFKAVKVVCGAYHSMVLTRRHPYDSKTNLISWGGNDKGQMGNGQIGTYHAPYYVSGMWDGSSLTWADVFAGEKHNIGIDILGRIFTWGASESGQIGRVSSDSTSTYAIPLPVMETYVNKAVPVRAISVAASFKSSFAVLNNGTAYSWGSNTKGELGHSFSSAIVQAPTVISILRGKNPKSITSGPFSRSVYADLSGSVFAWGDNDNGQFGSGRVYTTGYGEPVSPESYYSMSVSPASFHSLYIIDALSCHAIYATDPLVCSGHGNCTSQDMCLCRTGFAHSSPMKHDCAVPICYNIPASETSACSGHGQCLTVDTCLCHQGYSGEMCERKDEGVLYGSGDNSYGQLADTYGRMGVSRLIPVQSLFFFQKKVHSVAVGRNFSLILLSNGDLYSVGQNDVGQLSGSTFNRLNPEKILTLSNIAHMCAGERHSLAVDINGKIWAFGGNDQGQLGIGNTSNIHVPTEVKGPITGLDVVSVARGFDHSVALVRNGTLFTWGSNDFKQLGNERVVGPQTVPLTIHLTGILYKRRVSAIAAGGWSTLVIADDGTLYRWGYNAYRQLADTALNYIPQPKPLSNVPWSTTKITAIAAGSFSSYVVANSSTVYSVGRNYFGQLGLNNTDDYSSLQKVIDAPSLIPRIYASKCAEFNASRSRCHVGFPTTSTSSYVWGYNTEGQLGLGTDLQTNSPVKYHISYPDRRVLSMGLGCYHTLVLYDNSAACYRILSDEPSVCSYHGTCLSNGTCLCTPDILAVNVTRISAIT